MEDEVKKKLQNLAEGWRGWVHDQLDGTSFIADELYEIDATVEETRKAIMKLHQQEIAKAFEQGRKVGQYQTAETLYGDVTSIYLFKDGGTIKDLKLKQNADDHAKELLKDCERYMNENSRAYADYIRTLKEHKEKL